MRGSWCRKPKREDGFICCICRLPVVKSVLVPWPWQRHAKGTHVAPVASPRRLRREERARASATALQGNSRCSSERLLGD
ncbi:hypothetical protein NDU88_005706 [Pleurodeles waltl]|uniref:Uncharacterized protein n=1 Tax=Pleurodeles waltl TaxID=8319 RepID=A0AAV7TVJ5_PLEWA|nr:hypothetical protein NDU88_005706 [Pleurodeles waltl]